MTTLEKLKQDFAGVEPKEVWLPGLDETVFVHPLNGEESFALAAAARKENGREQALGFAALAVRKTKDKEGRRVFTEPTAAEDLAMRCSPDVLQAIIAAWTGDGVDQEAEELEKKSAAPSEAGDE